MKIIKGAEVSSFLSLGDTYFARDEKRIYAYGMAGYLVKARSDNG